MATPFQFGKSQTRIRQTAGAPVQLRTNSNNARPTEVPESCPVDPTGDPTGSVEDVHGVDVGKVTQYERKKIVSLAIKTQKELPELVIVKNNISLFTEEELKKVAVCQVNNLEDSGHGSVNDPRMGTTDGNLLCETCHLDNLQCPGHLGWMAIYPPVYHPFYLRQVISVLNAVCRSCSRIYLHKTEIRDLGLLKMPAQRRLEEIEKISVKKKCDHVHAFSKEERKKYSDEEYEKLMKDIETTSKGCKRKVIYMLSKMKESHQVYYKLSQKDTSGGVPLDIREVKAIFDAISTKDAKLLGFEGDARPSSMIITTLPVTPVITRYPTPMDDGSIRPNLLTNQYKNILKYTKTLREANTAAAKKSKTISEDTDTSARVTPDTLFMAIQKLLENNEKGSNTGMFTQFKSFRDLIESKDGVIRNLLMGKRGDYTARTVLSPDPTLKFGQIRIPKKMAPYLTPSEIVCQVNIKRLYALLEAGKLTDIFRNGDSNLQEPILSNPKKPYKLNYGDKVLRYLQNGDMIVFNRQPTLHKHSIMAYEVVLGDEDTIGLHRSYTTPHNADFDGDEGALYGLMSPESVAEASEIMNVKQCIMTASENKNIMGLVMDDITGAYLMTDSDTFVSDEIISNAVMRMTYMDDLVTIGIRLEKYHLPRNSGRALFSVLLPADFYYQSDFGGVSIVEGILITGQIDKRHVGPYVHRSIIQMIHEQYGWKRASHFLTDAPFVINYWLAQREFSVGIKDCMFPDPEAAYKIIRRELQETKDRIEAFGPPLENVLEESYREHQIKADLSSVKAFGVRLAKESMAKDNNIRIMVSDVGSGAKASAFNVAQMTGFLGQQFFRGERIKKTLTNKTRCLPHFPRNSEEIEALGFCEHSFSQGLNPQEFYFHHSGGREGLMDTANNTSESGYMNRRIVKALENIKVTYDGSIRNGVNHILRFVVGYDGFDPAHLINVKTDTGTLPFFMDVESVAGRLNAKYGFVNSKVYSTIERNKTLEIHEPELV